MFYFQKKKKNGPFLVVLDKNSLKISCHFSDSVGSILHLSEIDAQQVHFMGIDLFRPLFALGNFTIASRLPAIVGSVVTTSMFITTNIGLFWGGGGILSLSLLISLNQRLLSLFNTSLI